MPVLWGSQSWLQPAFSRPPGGSMSRAWLKRPPGKAAAGKIACPTLSRILGVLLAADHWRRLRLEPVRLLPGKRNDRGVDRRNGQQQQREYRDDHHLSRSCGASLGHQTPNPWAAPVDSSTITELWLGSPHSGEMRILRSKVCAFGGNVLHCPRSWR